MIQLLNFIGSPVTQKMGQLLAEKINFSEVVQITEEIKGSDDEPLMNHFTVSARGRDCNVHGNVYNFMWETNSHNVLIITSHNEWGHEQKFFTAHCTGGQILQFLKEL